MNDISNRRIKAIQPFLLLCFILLNGILMSWTYLRWPDFKESFWSSLGSMAVILYLIILHAFASYLQAMLLLLCANFVEGFIKEKKPIQGLSKDVNSYYLMALMLFFSLYTFRSGKIFLGYVLFSDDIATALTFK